MDYSVLLRFLPRIIFGHYKKICGIQLPLGLRILGGVRFMHYGGIVIAQGTKIGKNCSIHHGVTLGRAFSGTRQGCPIIGNNVVIFPGAKILGHVHIGDKAIISANSVVIRDVEGNTVVGGVPARTLKYNAEGMFEGSWKDFFCHD